MKSKAVVVSALLFVLVGALWYTRLYQPTKRSVETAQDETDNARRENQDLERTLAQLKKVAANGEETEAELAALHEALPEAADLAAFIRVANTMGEDAGITWVSVAPTEPSVTGQVATILLNIQVSGGYFQVLDYLQRMEGLSRLVIVDSVSIAAGGAAAGDTGPGAAATPGDGDSFGGAPELTVTLGARMFTTAGAAPAAATPVPGDATTPAPAAEGTPPATTGTASAAIN